MAQEKITFIKRTERTSKAGKPFTSLSLKVESRGDKWVGGFGDKKNEHWKEGDIVDILITPNGDYLNFVMAESKKGEELANNMKIDQVYSLVLDLKSLVISLCKAQGVATGYEDIQKAREAHNTQHSSIHSEGSSVGANGEQIKLKDVTFVPNEVKYPEDDINPEDIPFN